MADQKNIRTNDPYLCPEGFEITRRRTHKTYIRCDVSCEQLNLLLSHQAEVMKETSKTNVRALGHWVIKERKSSLAAALLAPSSNWRRHIRPWKAVNYLRARGVRVPEPLGYVEYGMAGLVTKSWIILQNLIGYQDVETYLSNCIQKGADGDVFETFLHHLAQAVNTLAESGAYHGDLSGKNIYTRDGVRFYFIDLDAVELDTAYDDTKRLRNHVQLYDSFCDALSDTLLVPFIDALLPASLDLRIWMPKVRQTQEERRTKVETHWAKHGQPEHINPLRAYRSHV